jgi:hypothetical protein
MRAIVPRAKRKVIKMLCNDLCQRLKYLSLPISLVSAQCAGNVVDVSFNPAKLTEKCVRPSATVDHRREDGFTLHTGR